MGVGENTSSDLKGGHEIQGQDSTGDAKDALGGVDSEGD